MCGFGAVIGVGGRRPEPGALAAIGEALRHRGPDDEGTHLEGHVGFAFRRLSILDLSAEGHQPKASQDGRWVIVYNGEIFNYIELRDELTSRGHRFRSTGDTEVLLAAWQEWGPACLPRLNGMFAFVLHDRTTGEVWGARDRFGVKPLFVHRGADVVVLASEIKGIVASGLYRSETNWTIAARYLMHGRLDDTPETFYAGITRVPAGHWFRLTPAGDWRLERWWSLPEMGDQEPADLFARYAELFEDAVRLRLRSDVPVGVCLSGGMDSTSVTCATARQRPEGSPPLLAFCYNAEEFDESAYVRDTLAQTGARLVPLERSGGRDLWEQWTRVLAANDEPVHSLTAVVQYGLMGLARQHGVPVVLTGDGADETTAGYTIYFRDFWFSLLRRGRIGAAVREIRAFAEAQKVSARAELAAVLRVAGLRAMARVPGYGSAAGVLRRRRLDNHPWFTPELTRLSEGDERRPGTLDGALRDSVERYPLPLYLRIVDRNSMAHSVEARDPFLDFRLVSFVFSLPERVKLRGPWNKYLLREAMRGRIPESVRARVEKWGFPTPTKSWLSGELREPVRSLIESGGARDRAIYRTSGLLSALERPDVMADGRSQALVRVAQFEMWSTMRSEKR